MLAAFLLAGGILAGLLIGSELAPWNDQEPFTAAMQSTMTFRRYLVLLAIMLTASCGDTFLSVGMRQVGPVSLHHLSTLLTALRVPWVLAGIVLLTAFFASYLTALSWADLTYVLPATSFGYVIIALLSRFWLHETITPARWAGILLITLGVGFVARGPSYTEIPKDEPVKESAPVFQDSATTMAKERSA